MSTEIVPNVAHSGLAAVAAWLSQQRTVEELAEAYRHLQTLEKAVEKLRANVKDRLKPVLQAKGSPSSDSSVALALPSLGPSVEVQLQTTVDTEPNDNKVKALCQRTGIPFETVSTEVRERHADRLKMVTLVARGDWTTEQFDACFVRREVIKVT